MDKLIIAAMAIACCGIFFMLPLGFVLWETTVPIAATTHIIGIVILMGILMFHGANVRQDPTWQTSNNSRLKIPDVPSSIRNGPPPHRRPSR